jgi:N-acetylmuramoyl-L-alanine amidase
MGMKDIFKFFVIGILLFSAHSGLATEDEDQYIITSPQDRSYRSPLKPSEIYSRTQSVLQHYNAGVQATGQDELNIFNGVQSRANIENMLQYFDVFHLFDKLFTLTDTELKSFDDMDGKSKLNFKVDLRNNLVSRHKIQGTPSLPLRGLRVSIDPGHMGEAFWDDLTGKFIKDSKGNYLSEGVLALQTSLLLQAELKKLGAEVELTRMGMTSVTSMDIKDLPIPKFAKNELLDQEFSPWFLKLLTAGVDGTLFRAFENSPDRKKLWSESSRANYFILKEDLWARAEKINKFNPDIVLILHYDILTNGSDGHGINKNSPNQTKIFVSGGYFDTEFGSRRARKQFAAKLLNQTQWEESISLSKNILAQYHSKLGLEFAPSAQGGLFVEPGIFARNLTLPRFLNAPAISYIETLFYNRPEEFYALSDAKYPMIINGVNYPYSDRLVAIVNALKQGVINYTSHLE